MLLLTRATCVYTSAPHWRKSFACNKCSKKVFSKHPPQMTCLNMLMKREESESLREEFSPETLLEGHKCRRINKLFLRECLLGKRSLIFGKFARNKNDFFL
ncbi:hypothetical protein CEXT_628471 [Caerostris extrusa]|uniref:Uncharacterized protein n=1 Tax=Caerostris extrusa TaxID=172846 RepID=A0AAV4W973_CAEEX|nr:hypothetical protein CEXT_628471 [Caerostris extrusa]